MSDLNEPFDVLAWREAYHQASTTIHVCENGLRLRIRKIPLGSLVERGEVPDPLMPAAERFLKWAPEPADVSPGRRLAERAAVIDLVVSAAVIDPSISLTPVDDDSPELYVKDIPFSDRIAIQAWAEEALPALARFPGPPTRNDTRPARGRQRVRSASEPAPERTMDGLSAGSGRVADEPAVADNGGRGVGAGAGDTSG